MNLLDIIIIIIFLIGFILGFKDGIIRKIIGLIGLVAGVFLAIYFANDTGKFIENIFGIELYFAEIIAGVTIFLLILLLFAVIKRIVHPFDKVNNIINQLLGGIVGAAQILFFLSAVFFLLNIFNVPGAATTNSSLFYKPVYDLIPATIDYINNYTPDSKDLFKKYINEKDKV